MKDDFVFPQDRQLVNRTADGRKRGDFKTLREGGLTKRELFVKDIFCSLLRVAAHAGTPADAIQAISLAPASACQLADLVLAELEKPRAGG